MRAPARAIAAVWLCALTAAGQAPQETLRIERLAALGKLWAAAKYFHPTLAYQNVDWDGALVAALPKAAAATSSSEYADAVQSMLDVLGDPATRVVREPAAPGTQRRGQATLSRRTEDGILILAINPETVISQAGLREAGAGIANAKGVVFDLRFQEQWSPLNSSEVGRVFILGGFNNYLAFGPLNVPGQRSRMHSGLASPWEGGSVFFHSAFYLRDGARIEAGNASAKPVVFLIDSSSALPPIAPALQAAGKARIVAQGSSNDAALVETHRVALPEGLEAQLRITELVYEDGTTGLTPDLILAAPEQALRAALDLARNPGQAAPPARRKLPAYATARREEAYGWAEYPRWEHRLMAGFRIWAAFQYFFAYRDLMGEDWDQVLAESLPRLEKASDAREYALAVAEKVAHVHDSHASFITGRALNDFFGAASPPLRTRMIEGVPVVASLLNSSDVEAGDIILKVDGEDAAARLKRLGRYVAASTPQSLDHLLMQRWLNGGFGSTAALTIRGRDGQVKDVQIKRNGEGRRRARTCPVTQMLPGNIGYADLDGLAPEAVDEMFEKFKNTRAIIFDMRGYPQGTAWLIAPRLTSRKQVAAARFRRPIAMHPQGRFGDQSTLDAGWNFIQYLPDPAEWQYQGQTVMLIDERAMSQAEHTGLFLEAANGTKFIGSRTAGANGDVARFTVPGGLTISFSGHDVRHADGRQLQRVGLIPDVEVQPTIEGIRSGRDEVLEKALEYLGVHGAKLSAVGEAR